MQLLRSNTPFILFLGFITGLSACDGGGGEGGEDGTTYNYNVTSTTFLTGGQQVAVVRVGISGNCSAITGLASATFTRVGAGTVTTPGTASFSFTTEITPPMVESVYIDNNVSGNLDNGDRVWGDKPNVMPGVCFDALKTDHTFDWEVVAAQIQADRGFFQPSIVFTSGPQPFRSEQGSEHESIIDNPLIVDGDGYDSIQW